MYKPLNVLDRALSKPCSLTVLFPARSVVNFFALIIKISTRYLFQRLVLVSSICPEKARNKFEWIPPSAHSHKRRTQVHFKPYLSRNSPQRAPFRKIRRMPLKHLRSSIGVRAALRLHRLWIGCCLPSFYCS